MPRGLSGCEQEKAHISTVINVASFATAQMKQTAFLSPFGNLCAAVFFPAHLTSRLKERVLCECKLVSWRCFCVQRVGGEQGNEQEVRGVNPWQVSMLLLSSS